MGGQKHCSHWINMRKNEKFPKSEFLMQQSLNNCALSPKSNMQSMMPRRSASQTGRVQQGSEVRKVPSKPDAETLADLVPKEWQEGVETTLPSERGSKLESLDKHEEERKVSQRRASNASKAEQLRIVSEMEHAEHEG